LSRPGNRQEEDDDDDEVPGVADSQRLDKWLWIARLIRTRTLAAGLVTDGKVRLNAVKVVKPSQSVRIGDVLTVAVGTRVRVLKIAGIGIRRGPAPQAQALFEDLSPPPAPVPDHLSTPLGGLRDAGSGRPTKRDRRQLDRLTWDDD